MKQRIIVGAALGLGISISGCTITPTSEAPPQFQTVEQEFDMQRCVNMGNSLEAPAGAPWGKPINPADFAVIKSKGFDTVRIPVRWSDYLGSAPGYEIDGDLLATVDYAVGAALAADLNVILNMHHNEEIVETPAEAMPAFIAAWEQISDHFKNAPADLWFEPLNEPYNELKGEAMQMMQRESVKTIRASNPERIIILGGEDWSGIRTLDTNIAPPDEKIVYTFHYYDPFDFTHQKAAWLGENMPSKERGWGSDKDRADLAEAADIAAGYRDRIGRPVFVGEFGANLGIPNEQRVKWAGAVRTEMEAHNIPWCLWAYSNTFALYDNDAEVWDEDMLSALLE